MQAAPVLNINFPLEKKNPSDNINDIMQRHEISGTPSSHIKGDRRTADQKKTREQQNRIKKILNDAAHSKVEKRGPAVISVMSTNSEPQSQNHYIKSGLNSQAILNELNACNGRVTLTDALGIPAIANISTPQKQIGRGMSRNTNSQQNKFAMTEFV